MTKEFELMASPSLRKKYINKTDVLDRVKALDMLPNIEVATTKQVAEFYEVDPQAIYSLIHDNKDEVVSDGYMSVESKELLKSLNSDLTSLREGVSIVKVKGGYLIDNKHKISYAKTGIFPKRAILRVGMLLRDSEVAKEVRTLLLDRYEERPIYTPVKPIRVYTEEDDMLLDIINGETKEERALALNKYKNYKDKQIGSIDGTLQLVEGQFDALVRNLGKLVDANKSNRLILSRR